MSQEKLKIGILVYPYYDFPPNGYGPMQEVACNLAEGLIKKGHEVSIFATADSKLSKEIEIIQTKETSITKDSTVPDSKIYEFVTIQKLLEHRHDFDVLSSHIGFHILPFIEFLDFPVVVNLQGDYSNIHYQKILNPYRNANFVGISNAQINEISDINFVSMIYHGLELAKFPFEEKSNDYLAFLGRLSPVKGLDVAVKIAKELDKNLKIGARYDESNQKEKLYFEGKIKPFLNKKIEFLGEQNFEQKIELIKNAKVLLFPIQWIEAFGLVMIEAMACGTPVIAFDRGSIREIIKDGVTGFICPPGDTDYMIKKVKDIYEMPEEQYRAMRYACRKRVEENFTVEKMIDGYEKVYKKVIEEWKNKKL